MDTSGVFNYVPRKAPDVSPAVLADLSRRSAVDPILKRWRDHCDDGLIDESGKVRNIFTKSGDAAEDNMTRVIRSLNDIPEALAELEAALAAQRELNALTRDPVSMPVHDARNLTRASLDDNGFLLVSHTSKVSDWWDDREIADTYYDEVTAVVKRVTGATHAFSNNHLRRQSEPVEGGNGPLAELMNASRGAVQTVHNDFAEGFGEAIARTLEAGGLPHTQTFGLSEAIIDAGVTADEFRRSRVLVVNTWRSVNPGALERFPLAVADRRSVPNECLLKRQLGRIPSGEPRGGIDIFTAMHSDEHRWFYYPGMTPDELLIFKGYDGSEVPARPTLHSAFDDPLTKPGAPERLSIEVRVLCLLPQATS